MVNVEFEGAAEFGAGIIFGREKDRLLIMTADHLLRRGAESPKNIWIKLRALPDRPLKAALLKDGAESKTDLAVLSLTGLAEQGVDVCALPFDRLGKAAGPKRGDAVSPVGNPNGVSWAAPVVPDRVTQIIGNEIVFQSAFISKGHSGGGLLDEKANLVGMTTADQPPFGRAIKMDVILQMVKQWGYPTQLHVALAEGKTPLHVAAESGDVVVIKSLLADCGNPNAKDDHNATPLHFAASGGNLDAMSILLKAGAILDAQDESGEQPLVWAVIKGQAEGVKFLIKAGAKVNTKSNFNQGGLNRWRYTPLHMAAAKGDLEIVKILVASGADINAKDGFYDSPLDKVYVHGRERSKILEIIRFLVDAGAKVDASTSMLIYRVKDADEESVKILLKGIVNINAKVDNTTLLCAAVSRGHLEIVKLLLKAGADINSPGHNNLTPLYLAISENKAADVEEFLIAHGGNFKGVALKDLEGLLWKAVENGRIEPVRLLIASGVNPNTYYGRGSLFSSLHLAIEKEYTDIVKLLVKAGADIEENETGLTPLQRAEK
jgi:ankyrin repeat protein